MDDWRQGLDPADGPAIDALFGRVRAADNRGPLGVGDVGTDAAVLVARVDGVPVGIAWRHGDDPAELVVGPDFRGRGIGTALATTVIDADDRLWAHSNLPAARAVARRLGLVVVRELLQLRRSPIGSWPVEVPEGARLRTFEVGRDEADFLEVNARAFAWHPEQGRFGMADLKAEELQDSFDPLGFFLAVDAEDTVLGFHQTKVHRHDPTPPFDDPIRTTDPPPRSQPAAAHDAGPPGPVGEVYLVGVDPRSPVRGLGRPLTAVGLNHLQGRGLDTVMLYVESDNEPALKLYRRFGFERYQSDVVYARP